MFLLECGSFWREFESLFSHGTVRYPLSVFNKNSTLKRKHINEIVTTTSSFASIYEAMGSGIRVVSNTCPLCRNVGLFGGNLSLFRVTPQYEKKPTVCFQLKTLLSKCINEIVSTTLSLALSLASIYEAISRGANIELQPFEKKPIPLQKKPTCYIQHTTRTRYIQHTTRLHLTRPWVVAWEWLPMCLSRGNVGRFCGKCGSLLRECGYVVYATPHSPLSTRPWVVASE